MAGLIAEVRGSPFQREYPSTEDAEQETRLILDARKAIRSRGESLKKSASPEGMFLGKVGAKLKIMVGFCQLPSNRRGRNANWTCGRLRKGSVGGRSTSGEVFRRRIGRGKGGEESGRNSERGLFSVKGAPTGVQGRGGRKARSTRKATLLFSASGEITIRSIEEGAERGSREGFQGRDASGV